jgi:hypothetical protein
MPVKGVVPDLGSVVEQWAAGALDNVFERFVGVVGAFDQTVELGYVSVVVLAVMVLKSLLRDVWFQCVLFIGQCGKFKCHEVVLPDSLCLCVCKPLLNIGAL